jgi:hypothetical protein
MINTVIIEVIFIDTITVTVTAHVIIEALPDPITEAIITHAILGTILLDERSGSVAGRLEGDSPVLVARVDGADAGDLPRSQDASDCTSRRDLQNSEVTSRFVKGSQLLAVSKSLTASNFASRLSETHFTVLSGGKLQLPGSESGGVSWTSTGPSTRRTGWSRAAERRFRARTSTSRAT